jgi:hypothetical protein
MRVRDAGLVLVTVMLACLIAGCASTMAPRDRLPRAIDAGRDARGGWAVLDLGPAVPRRIMGELIAVEQDSVCVLTESGFTSVARTEIARARVAGFESTWPLLAGWTAVGTASTLSHGFGLVLSAPIWLIAGTLSTIDASRAGILRHPPRDWSELAPYARFPQGLPAELRSGSLSGAWPPPAPPESQVR